MSVFKTKAIGTAAQGATDGDQVRRALALLADPNHGIELRALPFGKSVTGRFDDPKLLAFCDQHTDATGIYYTLNPVKTDLNKAANVPDILHRRWLMVDIDPERPADSNATDGEHDSAASKAATIVSEMSGFGWPIPVLIDSGNGWHLLYRIDLPADDESRILLKGILGELAKTFDSDTVKIDTKVFNANRIAKLPGTWARKGPHSAERPHRLCRIVSAPESPTLLTVEQIRAMVPAAERPSPPSPNGYTTPEDALRGSVNGSGNGTAHGSVFKTLAQGSNDSRERIYGTAALEKECEKLRSASVGNRNQTFNDAVFAVFQCVAAGWINSDLCRARLCLVAEQIGLSSAEVAATFRSASEAGLKQPRKSLEDDRKGQATSKPRDQTAHDRERPKIVLGDDLIEMDIPAPRWAVPGLLPEGLTILAGKPKLGKSFLALGLALTVAAGGTALGTTKVIPGDVLYLALEDRLRRIQDRIRKMMGGLGVGVSKRIGFATAWPRTDNFGLDYIEEWCRSVERPALIVIDVWAKFRPIYKTQGSQYDQDYQHGTAVKEVADKYAAAALALHHTKKAAVEDVIDEISGTLGIAGSADGTLVLKRARGESDGTISITGRDVDERDLAVSFDQQTCVWKTLGDGVKGGRIRAAILAAFAKANGPLSPSEVAMATGENRSSIKTEMWKMAGDDALRRVGNKYALPLKDAAEW